MTALTSSSWSLLEGKCEEVLATMASNSVDSIVTDPPYELGFMGKRWDASGIAYSVEMWREALRVLKPGGYLLAFGGTRTYHRMAVAIEDAGFLIRDSIHWIYGSGFPKSLNISKAIDAAAGAEREVVGEWYRPGRGSRSPEQRYGLSNDRGTITLPATLAAQEWQGYGTALKPAHEPIVVAQKPLSGTYAANVIEWGCGALNIDGCRVAAPDGVPIFVSRGEGAANTFGAGIHGSNRTGEVDSQTGRWPTNLVLTHSADCGEECAPDCPVALLDRQSVGASRFYPTFRYEAEDFAPFLYCAKPSQSERNAGLASLPIVTAAEMTGRREGSAGLSNPRAGTSPRTGAANHHPTVKPIALMRWLVRLVTPHHGTTLDIFGGSGTSVAAALREGKRAIAIEMTPEYWPIIRARAEHHAQIALTETADEARRSVQPSLFDDYPPAINVIERAECRCWSCRGVFVCERDQTTGQMVCHACRGERHRLHYAAWAIRRISAYDDDGIDF